MCVGFWSLNDPDYSLVLCTNRDEYLSRPTKPAHWHAFGYPPRSHTEPLNRDVEQECPNEEREETVLSGIDILAGGTWFGINKRGEVALLTNITEPGANLPSSRGHLCSSFLLKTPDSFTDDSNTSWISQFVDGLISSETRYSGFNLLLLAPQANGSVPTSSGRGLQYDSAFVSNSGAGKPIVPITPPTSANLNSRKCGGISNSVPSGLDPFTHLESSSEWLKVVQGRDLLSKALTLDRESEDVLVERLFNLLRTKTRSPPSTRHEFQENILIDPVDMAALRRGPTFAQSGHPAVGGTSDVHSPERPDLSSSHSTQSFPRESHTISGELTQKKKQSLHYATRLSSVLLVRRDGNALFMERDIWIVDPDGRPALAKPEVDGDYGIRERRFSFRVEGAEGSLDRVIP